MKLWIDDVRDAPDETWRVVRNNDQAIRAIEMHGHNLTHVSLDHDINQSNDTFKSTAYYLALLVGTIKEEQMYRGDGISYNPIITVHSSNPVGAKEIQLIFDDAGIIVELKPIQNN